MSNIACPQCGASIPSEHASLVTLVARCSACDHVFRFDAQLSTAAAAMAIAGPMPPRPARFTVSGGTPIVLSESGYREPAAHGASPIEIRWRWFTPQAIFLACFALAWDAFLVFWYGIGIATGGPWIMFVFPLAHVAVGVGITYSAFSKILNTTRVTLDANELRSATRPIRLPWKRDLSLARGSVGQIVVMERKKNRGAVSYDVVAYDHAGTTHVVGNFEAEVEARYLARLLGDAGRVGELGG